jgi:hypothetical protein
MDNFLALEPLLMARLKAQLGALKVHVLAQADLDGVKENEQLNPALHVIYQGAEPKDVRSDGRAARFEQTWLVVVATRNVASIKTGEDARLAAGALATVVLSALMGHKPTTSSKPLRLTSAPGPVYRQGFMYVPFAFTAEVTVTNPLTIN